LLKVRVLERGWRKKGEIQSEVPLEIVRKSVGEKGGDPGFRSEISLEIAKSLQKTKHLREHKK